MDTLRIIEKQSGFLRLIYYLGDRGERSIKDIMDDTNIPVHQLYSSIEKGKELGIIKTRIDNDKYPPRNLISLTQRGVLLSEKLREIITIIEG